MASVLYKEVAVRPMHKDRYKLLKEFTYKDIVVPEGYETNGADIPRFLWVFLPPNRADYLPAVIVHDYLCDLQKYNEADDYFESMLKELEVGKKTRMLMVKGVRFYHCLRYKACGKNK